MTITNIEPFKVNWLLSAFADPDLERLSFQLKPMLFNDGHLLYQNKAEHDWVYFPKSGLLSVVLGSDKGINVEVGIVGREGAANLLSALTGQLSIGYSNVQIPGSGWQMPGSILRQEFGGNAVFRRAVMSYLYFYGAQSAQSILCNRLHNIDQRLSRWLLMSQDRTGTQILEITHEFLANMLGTNRVGVTLAAKALREAGFIDYGRRNVVILDREGLENNACECYAATLNQQDEIQLSPMRD